MTTSLSPAREGILCGSPTAAPPAARLENNNHAATIATTTHGIVHSIRRDEEQALEKGRHLSRSPPLAQQEELGKESSSCSSSSTPQQHRQILNPPPPTTKDSSLHAPSTLAAISSQSAASSSSAALPAIPARRRRRSSSRPFKITLTGIRKLEPTSSSTTAATSTDGPPASPFESTSPSSILGFKTPTASPPAVTPSFAVAVRANSSAGNSAGLIVEPDGYFFGFSRVVRRDERRSGGNSNPRRNSDVRIQATPTSSSAAAATATALRRGSSCTDVTLIQKQQHQQREQREQHQEAFGTPQLTAIGASLANTSICCLHHHGKHSNPAYLLLSPALASHAITDMTEVSSPSAQGRRSSLRLTLPPPNPALGTIPHSTSTTHSLDCRQQQGCNVGPRFPIAADTPEYDHDGAVEGHSRAAGAMGLGSYMDGKERDGPQGQRHHRIMLAQGNSGLALLTPPEEASMEWKQEREQPRSHNMSMGNMGSSVGGTTQEAGPQRTGSGREEERQSSMREGSLEPTQEDAERKVGWLDDALDAMLSTGLPIHYHTEAVRILSYTVPCPITMGEQGRDQPLVRQQDRLPASAASAPAVAAAAGFQLGASVTARCTSGNINTGAPELTNDLESRNGGVISAENPVISAVQRLFASHRKQAYIHVSHAVSPLFPLNRVPATPPVLQQSSDQSSSYFSPSVFNSIVLARTPTSPPNTPLLLSPTPILPPSSLHYTVYERFIPPSSVIEDTNLFHPTYSPLLPRLLELSPCSGSLLLIYPTRAGAQTFLSSHLSPILDPLLRKLMVLYRLRESLLWDVRRMPAIATMRDFATLSRDLSQLAEKAGGKVVWSGRKRLKVSEWAWREWWAEQESERIRETVKRAQAASPSYHPPPPSSTLSTTTGTSTSSKSIPHSTSTTRTPHTTSTTTLESSNSEFVSGYGFPGDLAREIIDGVRVNRPSSRGMHEALHASTSVRGSANGAGEGFVRSRGMKGGKGEEDGEDEEGEGEGWEFGVFVVRRGGEA